MSPSFLNSLFCQNSEATSNVKTVIADQQWSHQTNKNNASMKEFAKKKKKKGDDRNMESKQHMGITEHEQWNSL